MIDVNSNFIDLVFDAIYTKLENNFTYTPILTNSITICDEELLGYNEFTIQISSTIEGSVYYYTFKLYQINKYNLLYKILRYFKKDTYFLSVLIRRGTFTENSYKFKSNKENYDSYKKVYQALIDSRPKYDKKKYEESVLKWSKMLSDKFISVSMRRNDKLEKLINKEKTK
jgi:hypothetical protein